MKYSTFKKHKNLFLFVIIFIISIFITLSSICKNINLDNSIAEKDLVELNSKNINLTIGIFTYQFKSYYKAELERIARCIEIIDRHKRFRYTPENRFDQNMISIKLEFFHTHNENNNCDNNHGVLDFDKFAKFVDLANRNDIMIGIDAMLEKNKQEELNTYLKLIKLGYNNVFITLACYREDIDERVDIVLKNKGHIRLVKGYYSDNTVKEWSQVTANYLRNAKKLVEDNNFHIIATHDFEILQKLYQEYGSRMDQKQIAFFELYKSFVQKKLSQFPYKIKHISYYKPYGRVCLSLTHMGKYIHLTREFQRRVLGKVY
jgi:hypothetical protein